MPAESVVVLKLTSSNGEVSHDDCVCVDMVDHKEKKNWPVSSIKGMGVKAGSWLKVTKVEIVNPYIRISKKNNILIYKHTTPSGDSFKMAAMPPGDYSPKQICDWVNKIVARANVVCRLLRNTKNEAFLSFDLSKLGQEQFGLPTAEEIESVLSQQLQQAHSFEQYQNRSIWSTLGFVLPLNAA